MKRLWCVSVVVLSLWGVDVSATDFSELGRGLYGAKEASFDLDGYLRLRLELLDNLDLDHGQTPSGQVLYPVPLSDDKEQTLRGGDLRFRTDFSAIAPYGAMRVNLRVDVLDNAPFGQTPRGTPLDTTNQNAPTIEEGAFRVRRAYGEALTPFGVIAAGRMANSWGLGMLANGGDCLQCDTAAYVDRVAFVTTQFDHFIAASYDINYAGQTTTRPNGWRQVDPEPNDNVSTWTFALLRRRDDLALERRNEAGRLTLDYGAFYSYQQQSVDIPATYVASGADVKIDENKVIERGYSAHAWDAWARLMTSVMRIEVEAALVTATIEEPSLVAGVRYGVPLESTQFGAVLESDFGPQGGSFFGGLDFGVASGDAAYGFGASGSLEQAQAGDFEGSQVNPPFDTQANNFRFSPDYQVDQILFREILGTVTDAYYIRPHVTWEMWRQTAGRLNMEVVGVASWAQFASSTPGSESPLGFELDAALDYKARDGFRVRFDYAVLFPFAGLDNIATGQAARRAQLGRVILQYGF